MMRLREFSRKILSATLDAISFGDIVFVAGIALAFHGLQLVYGFGWACIGTGATLAAVAYMGEFFAMTAMLIHGGRNSKRPTT